MNENYQYNNGQNNGQNPAYPGQQGAWQGYAQQPGARQNYAQPGAHPYAQPWQQPYPAQPWQQPGAQPGYGISVNIGPQAPLDPGVKFADDCKTFGILSLFFLPLIFAIIALVKYGNYQRVGNGLNQSSANTGRVCAIISLVLQGVVLIGTIVIYALMIAGVIAMGW